jgi:hypothetical protein
MMAAYLPSSSGRTSEFFRIRRALRSSAHERLNPDATAERTVAVEA